MNKTTKKQEGLALSKSRGFTLIEILVVIGIIAILAAVVLIAINPAKQFRQARNSQRSSNVNAILNAVGQYIADNKGDLPPSVETLTVDTDVDVANTGVDLCDEVVPTYIPALPTDPDSGHNGEALDLTDCGAAYNTGYKIRKGSVAVGSRITIKATLAEDGAIIEVTR